MDNMRSVMRVAMLIAAPILAVAVVGCGSGSKSRASAPASATTPTVAAQAAPISDADAQNMTLGAADFGPQFADYGPAPSTGPLILQDFENDPCAADLLPVMKRLAFERGYNRDWVRPASASRDQHLGVGSYVEVYPDVVAAHEKLAFDQRQSAQPLPAGCQVQVESSAVFVVENTGEEAFGYRKTTIDGGRRTTFTWVEFRRGRVIGNTDAIRDDAEDTAFETKRFATTLDAHLMALLAAAAPNR